jgi:hypothetical protein
MGKAAAEPEGIYLYCFTRPGVVHDLGIVGIDGRRRVTALEVGRVAAVVSPVAVHEFAGPDAQSRVGDPQWVVPRACKHERVVEQVMGAAPVLPVRFGTVFSSREVLREFLAAQGDAVSAILDRLSGKQEWAVKGFADLGRVRRWLTSSDPVLAEQHRRQPQSPGTRYFHERRLETQMAEAIRFWRRAAAEEIRSRLAAHAVDSCPLALQARSATGRDAEMVFHAAHMLAADEVESFRQQVEATSAAYGEQGLALELSGPWPPYNFCPPMRRGQDEALGVLRTA